MERRELDHRLEKHLTSGSSFGPNDWDFQNLLKKLHKAEYINDYNIIPDSRRKIGSSE